MTFNVTDGYQTISPINATVTIKGHGNVATYDGTTHSVSGYDVSFSNDLYKESDFTFSGTAEAAQTDAGTTNMGLTEDMFANTNTNFSTVVFIVTDGYQTINKKVVSPIVTVTPKMYDGSTDAQVNVSIETGVSGESLTVSGLTATFNDANAGTDKAVTVNSINATVAAGEGTKLENYDVNYPNTVEGTIKPKTLTVTADAKTKNVGEKDPEFTYTYDGLVEGEHDVFSGALSRNEGEEAGTYAIMLGTLSAGTNYAITFKGANLTIIDDTPEPVIPEEPTYYKITIFNTEGGKVNSSHVKATGGQQVNLVVIPEEGYEMSSLVVVNNSTRDVVATGIDNDDEGNEFWKFYMPAADVTVVATFVKPGEEHEQNIFIFNNLYGEVVSNLLYAAQGQQVNLETRIKNGYKNTILDELFVINDKGEQLQLFYIEDPIEGPVHFFFMRGEKAYVYNSFKGINAITDDTKSLRLDGYLMYLLSGQYRDFLKTDEGVEDVQLAMTFLANILANFTPDGELSVDQGPEDLIMAVLNLLGGWKIKIDFTGIIQLLNPEILGLGNGATLESGQIYELLAPGNLELLLNSSYGPLLIKAITVIAPEEDPTAINGLKAGCATGDTYDLRGRKVDTNTLRKGIYIRDGRKIVIK